MKIKNTEAHHLKVDSLYDSPILKTPHFFKTAIFLAVYWLVNEKSDFAIVHASRIRDAVRTPCRTNSRIPIFCFVRLDHSNVSSARANLRIGPLGGEIDRSMHRSLYHSARLLLCTAPFGVTTNYIVSPKNWSPNKWRSSVYI